jgi:hypothetical protein
VIRVEHVPQVVHNLVLGTVQVLVWAPRMFSTPHSLLLNPHPQAPPHPVSSLDHSSGSSPALIPPPTPSGLGGWSCSRVP